MKNKITKLAKVPITIKEIKIVLQVLWNQIKPEDWRYLTKKLTVKIKDMIAAKRIVTIY
jgi:hypothetical protein